MLRFFRKKREGGSVEWLAVFLGNPGAKYANTRHNAGFMAGDALAARLGVKIDRLKFKSLTARASIAETSVLLMKPQTYMNLSGEAAREAMGFYKIPVERVLVVSDEMALPLGKLRLRRSGSAGGHNGLKSIIALCGGDGFPRLRIGVGEKPHPDMDAADWVLSPFRGAELEEIAHAAERAAECVERVVADGVDAAMGKFN